MKKKWEKISDKHNLETIWCDDHLKPKDVVYKEDMVLFYDGGWGKYGFEHISAPVTNEKLYIAADKLIRASGDSHHCFIEAIKQVDGILFTLHTGS